MHKNRQVIEQGGHQGGDHVEIVRKINADTVAVLNEPAIKSKLEGLGLLVEGSNPGGLMAQMKIETDRWGTIIKDGAIKASD